jgi:uncharacterized protein (TIGR03437 family)
MRICLVGLVMAAGAGLVYGQSSPTVNSVTDAYSGGIALAPGSLAVIKGTLLNIATSVTVGGKQAFVVVPPYQAGGSRMTVQIPVDAPVGLTNLVVTPGNGAAAASFALTLAQFAPVLISSTAGTVTSPNHQQSGLVVTSMVPATSGETVVVSGIGLGATNPQVATGTAPVSSVATAASVSVTLGGNPIAGATAALAAGQVGIYQVTFTVPQGTAAGNYAVVASIGGVNSNAVNLSVGAAPTGPAVASVVDALTSSAALCPGDLAVVNGVNLGANPQVTVGGKAAFLVQGPQNGTQMTIEIPVDAAVGNADVVVRVGGQASPAFSLVLAQYAPVLNSTPIHVSTGAAVTFSNPALPGETIGVFAIGLGPTSPVVPTGTPSPSGVQLALAPQVYVNNANPLTSGVTATLVEGRVGMYEITFPMPAPPNANPYLEVAVGPPAQGAGSNFIHVPASVSGAPPSIDRLANNYSYTLPGLPNYGIAQGSIFDVFGSNLSNGSTGLLSVPLTTSVLGTTVDVTVNGTTTHALLYYTTPSQIAAILPSATPVGDGTITVTKGGMSASASIHVVQSAFGILTLNGGGTGPAAAFDVNNQYLGFTNALNPGDYFILWGSGVGPAPGDESVTQLPTDLSSVPFSIEVGGVPAQVYYRGRSQYPGLDQVIGIVPGGVTPGCWVSVVTRSGNVVSNFATVPVASSGRVCADDAMGLTAAQMQELMARKTINVGILQLDKLLNTQYAIPNAIVDVDAATAQFMKVNTTDFASAPLGPSLGSCMVVGSLDGVMPWPRFPAAALDAGPSVRVTSGTGMSATIPYVTNIAAFNDTLATALWAGGQPSIEATAGAYAGKVGGAAGSAPLMIPDTGGGTYTFDNGSGGGDVSAFQGTVTVPSPVVSWFQAKLLPTVSLTGGLTVVWSGVDPQSYVQISGRSTGAGASLNGATIMQFTCTAPGAAGKFTIPDSVLKSIPPYGALSIPAFTPLIQLSQMTFPQAVTIPNLQLAFAQAMVQYTITVVYQ